jgi:hypothetical protein
MPLDWWLEIRGVFKGPIHYARLSPSMMRSAHTFGALLGAPMGPKGGVYYAVESPESWKKWRAVWLRRIHGKMAAEVRHALESER